MLFHMGAPISGLSVNRSMISERQTAATMERSMDGTSGHLRRTVKVNRQYAARAISSPWTMLMTSVALKIRIIPIAQSA